MEDRELLELAAKAAGYEVDKRASFMTWREHKKLTLINPQNGHTLWNAKEDDGDALRLSANLGMNVFHAAQSAYALPSEDDGENEERVRYAETKGDKAAATRLAIVRVATEIGKSIS